MLGIHGTRSANYAMDNDRPDRRGSAPASTTGSPASSEFAPRAKFIHIDIDPAEISKNVPAHIPIVGDARGAAEADRRVRALQPTPPGLDAWWKQIDGWQEEYPLG